ncbi:ADL071Cp [Eremothecium gossypii ATCC 10895]|uniref:glycerol-1-phosphatase n=1 Tax=Eremothecium gossypii (strain ATCC 10895 / CBS 109.51 / FGSC 9923 / NRRL Y-1056) TaxID=284811 RepID=Q75AJ8_EREGS|nr:ADL071Cp [Eremothecium gossypii ATCC 10895]AAS51849.1 ADL071Cp [Eremothecium gossypii ATCC 10895]AEY96146.1 FADL071Cp [Eremothecium gossypii FDAG1]
MTSTADHKQPISLKVNGALFDVDGTIIISQPALAAFWREFGKDKPYFDAEHVISATHGWRTYDAIATFAPDYLSEEYVTRLEGEIPDKYGKFSVEVPGAVTLCNALNELPKEKWAVGTSGTFEMAHKWFDVLGIKRPSTFITANDVKQGKPHPEPYIKGRNALGFPINEQNPKGSKVIVFEDAPAGIAAGKAAGCKIVGVATTFDVEYLKERGCDIIVKDHRSIRVGGYNPETDEVEFVFDDYLYAKDDLLDW